MIAAVVIAGTVAPTSQAVALRAVPVPEPVSAVQAAVPSVAPTSDPSRIVVEVMGFQNLGTRNPSDPIERVGSEQITKDVLRVANVTISDAGRSGRALRYPVRGPITSQFGLRFHPIRLVWKLHSGTDFGVGCGTPVGAAAAGTVTFAGYNMAYGNRIIIDHGTIAGLRVSTTYNHLSGLGVRVGQKVVAGQGIALSGNTGWSTGCHLHLEVLVNGQFTNPMPWLTGKPASPSDVVLTGNSTSQSDSNTSAQSDRPAASPVTTVRPTAVTTVRPSPETTPTQTASGTRPPRVPASTTPAPSTPAASDSGSTPATSGSPSSTSTSTESTPQPPSAPVTSPSLSRTSTLTQPAADTQPEQPPAETVPPAPEPTKTDAAVPSAAVPAEIP